MRVPLDDLAEENGVVLHQGTPFTGVAYAPRLGRLIEEIEYEGGLMSGRAREWYPSGVLKVDESYALGSKHGISTLFSESGAVQSRETYEFSIRTERQEASPTGALVVTDSLADDHPQRRTLALLRSKLAAPRS